MPRVKPLTELERKKDELRRLITGRRKAEGINLCMLGKKLGCSGPGAGYKINNGSMDYTDLILTFKEIGATDEEILRVMRI